MNRFGMAIATVALIALIGCAQKEEPKTEPEEMPVPAMPADTVPAPPVDTIKSVEEVKTTTTTKKKTTTTAVQKNDDGSATAVQVRPSRTEKKEDDASSTQIRKSR